MKKLFLVFLLALIMNSPCFSWTIMNSDKNINIKIKQKVDSSNYPNIKIINGLKIIYIKNKDIFAEKLENFLKIENNAFDEIKNIFKTGERLDRKLDSDYFIEYNYDERYNIEIPNVKIPNIFQKTIYEKVVIA